MTIVRFPELEPVGSYDDATQGGGLSLGFVTSATVEGLTATAVRYWQPAAVPLTVEGFIRRGSDGIVLRPPVTATGSAVGWLEMPLATPLPLPLGLEIVVGVFLSAAELYSARTASWPLAAAGLSSPDSASRFNYSAESGLAVATPGRSAAWFGMQLVVDDGQIAPVDPEPQPAAAQIWTGSALVDVDVDGIWDGSSIRPVTLEP